MSSLIAFAHLFTDDKTVDNPTLNRAGAQPFRTVLARLLYKLRSGSRDPLMAELTGTGLLVIEDFLAPAAFEALEREADDLMVATEPTWLVSSGTTKLTRHSLAHVDPERFPNLAQWRLDARIATLASGAERRKYPRRWDGGALAERLTVGDYSQPDGETELHIDTFFDTHKIWLYLDDVDPSNAPFVYVPGSHLLDRVRLRYEYLESTTSNRRSRRVGEDEVRQRGLERRTISCRRNTLLVANTFGYHCRSVGEAGAFRRSLHREYRQNPFELRWARRPRGSGVPVVNGR